MGRLGLGKICQRSFQQSRVFSAMALKAMSASGILQLQKYRFSDLAIAVLNVLRRSAMWVSRLLKSSDRHAFNRLAFNKLNQVAKAFAEI